MSKVIVAGSINMDIVAFTERHPKVGETVFGSDLNYFPGGKGANQAVSASKLGGETTIVGMVGTDGFGKELVKFLGEQGINNKILIAPETPTGTALIIVSTMTSNNTIVVIPGANFKLTENDIKTTEIEKGDILVCQFEIPTETIKAFFKRGKKVGTVNILNPAPAKTISKDLQTLVDILVLNETELEILSESKVDVEDENSISNAVNKIKIEGQSIIVTLGDKGVLAFIKDTVVKIEAQKVKAVDTTGAGDCFVGALAAKLSKSSTLVNSIEFANVAASICVTRQGAGTSMPTLNEVNHLYPKMLSY
jgi:ribokinase